MPLRKFWFPMSIINRIDAFILEKRNERRAMDVRRQRKSILKINLSSNDVYFQDMLFFYKKGIKIHYLKRIFEDFEKHDALKIPAVGRIYQAVEKNQPNTYDAANQINLYEHTIACAKMVYTLKDFNRLTLNNAALFALIHDAGKIKSLMKECSIGYGVNKNGGHETGSAIYASLVITDKEDFSMVESFRDWLERDPSHRKFPDNIFGKILDKVDIYDRVENQKNIANINRKK